MAYTGKKPTDHTDVTQSQSMTVTDDLTVDGTTLHVDSTNNRVGVGITSPEALTHIAGATADADGSLGSQSPQLIIEGGNTNNPFEIGMDNSGATAIGFLQSRNKGAGAQFISLNPKGGNVGIGTTTPEATLDVMGNSDSVAALKLNGGNDNHGFHFYTTSSEGDLVIKREASGTQTEAMRITRNAGNVALGTTSTSNKLEVRGTGLFSSDGNYRASNSGILNVSPNGNLCIGFGGDSDSSYYAAIFHNSSNTAVGSIFVGASSTTFATSSDHRLKENVADLTGAIDRIKTLAPKRFNFIADPDTTVDGFLAHEVTAVPEAIVGTHNQVDDDDNPVYQGIDQAKLVPVLTAALQEAIAKIETLETKVAALEAE